MSIFDFFKRKKKPEVSVATKGICGKDVLEHIGSVSVWSGENSEVFNKEQLDGRKLELLLEETLSGKRNKLVMELEFQGEGTFVKKLNKTVYKNWVDHVVIHNTNSQMALIYIAKEKLKGFELIADYDIYCHKDSKEIEMITIGTASVPEYVVHKNRQALDEGLKIIFGDIETAAERLYNSDGLWHIIFLQGMKGYHKLCEQAGIPLDE